MRRAFFLVPFLFALVLPWQAHAQRIGLSNLVVDNQEGRVKVRFGVDMKAAETVREALQSGEILALECKARLSRKREYAWNTQVAEAEMISRLTLHEGGPFEIYLPMGRQERYRGRDLALLMKEAWGTMALDLGSWEALGRGGSYSLSLEIRMVRQDVSAWLKGALFFWNFDAVPPVKYQLDFSY
ncbi:MAG: DUF4390 domain-containing protein [Acidobacteriota bacterium]